MTSSIGKMLSSAMVAAAPLLFAAWTPTPALAQTTPTVLRTVTSPIGLTITLSSANPSDAVGVNHTYTWTAINNSPITLQGVILGSHWGDYCALCASPTGPTLISLASGCNTQSSAEFPEEVAHMGVWCTPIAGVPLAPGQSVSGSLMIRPGTGGPANYFVYSLYLDPKTGNEVGLPPAPSIAYASMVAPATTDIQITGAASNGGPPAGSTFTYTYQVKDAEPWGTDGGIILVDTLPASLTYVSSSLTVVSPSTGQPVEVPFCSVVGQTVMCPLFDMQNGGPTGQETITITVAASSVAQQIVNTATVHTVSPQTDSNPANNSTTVIVTTR